MFRKAYSKVSILYSPVGSINGILRDRINELASEGQISNIGMTAPHSHKDTRLSVEKQETHCWSETGVVSNT